MRIAIIDDERQWVAYAKKFISNHYKGSVTEIDGYLSGLEFMKKLKQYDIVIMDLEMPDQDGFKTISEYKKIYKKSIILILTSHMELAQKGYIVNAFRYLNKANLSDELEAALISIDELKSLDETVALNILNAGKQNIIISDIIFFETEKRNLRVHTTHESFICTDTMEHVEKLLSSRGFFRSHKSFLVNLSMVRSYDKNDIIMINNEKAMVSVRKHSELNKVWLNWRYNHANS